jgi:Cys-tRNA(Pro)/Cys-tRNA(Cys) deacylase
MTNLTPAIEYLQNRSIPHRVFTHPGPVESLEQAAQERGERPAQVVRSIVFRQEENEFVMVLVAGPAQIPWKELRKYLGKNRLSMATEEELLAVTGCRPGTVSPFGVLRPMRILIDECILAQPEVSLGSCRRGTAILIKPPDLIAALDSPEIIRFACPSAEA